MVNPRAAYETEYPENKAQTQKTVVIVGLGVAGLSCAYYAAKRGHHVIAYDAANLGGQFNLAAKIPGKEIYAQTIRYFDAQLSSLGVDLRRNHKVVFEDLRDIYADAIVFATGVTPRRPSIPGIEHFSVMDYETAINNKSEIKDRVAIIGAGGIGFDVATFLAENSQAESGGSLTTNPDAWLECWGVDKSYQQAGALNTEKLFNKVATKRDITLLQRKTSKVGNGLGKTSGWVHRANLTKHGVKMVPGVNYKLISDKGLLIEVNGKEQLLEVDNVIICAGQESNRDLQQALESGGITVHLIGGANVASELDAKRAIRQAAELAMII